MNDNMEKVILLTMGFLCDFEYMYIYFYLKWFKWNKFLFYIWGKILYEIGIYVI